MSFSFSPVLFPLLLSFFPLLQSFSTPFPLLLSFSSSPVLFLFSYPFPVLLSLSSYSLLLLFFSYLLFLCPLLSSSSPALPLFSILLFSILRFSYRIILFSDPSFLFFFCLCSFLIFFCLSYLHKPLLLLYLYYII